MENKKNGQRAWFLGRYVVWSLLCLAGISLACLNLASCDTFWPVVAVRITLPALPAVWSGADGWELDWRCMDEAGESRLVQPGATLVLFLPRTSYAAIRCRPVFGSSRGQPYGAIWPLHADPDGFLILSSGGGFSAELAFRLYQGGYDAARFNLGRFAIEATLRMADPWESDMAVLARAVAEGGFRADYLRAPVRTQVAVRGLAGFMAPSSPWGRVLEPDVNGCAVVAASPGIHRWFGVNQELVVSVSSDGSSEWILRGAAGRVSRKLLP